MKRLLVVLCGEHTSLPERIEQASTSSLLIFPIKAPDWLSEGLDVLARFVPVGRFRDTTLVLATEEEPENAWLLKLPSGLDLVVLGSEPKTGGVNGITIPQGCLYRIVPADGMTLPLALSLIALGSVKLADGTAFPVEHQSLQD